jgi:hypothetical protein
VFASFITTISATKEINGSFINGIPVIEKSDDFNGYQNVRENLENMEEKGLPNVVIF